MKLFAILIISTLPAFGAGDGIDKEEVRDVVRKNMKDVLKCYETSLKKDPNLAGKVVLEWDVNDQGKVTKAGPNKEKTTLKSDETLKCMVEKLKSWKFPKARAGETVSVSYPFVFSKVK